MVLSLQAEQPVKPTHNDSWSCSKLHAAQPWSTWKRERQRVGATDDTSAGREWKMGGPISWSPRGDMVSETAVQTQLAAAHESKTCGKHELRA